MTLNRFWLCAAPLVVCLALALLPAMSARAQGQSGGTVIICEATGNPNAPYVEVDVAQSDLGNYGAAEGDIIPAPASGCPATVAGTPKRHHKHTSHPTTHAAPTPTRATTSPAPLASTPPRAAQPAVAAEPDEAPPQATPAAPIQALPKTGGPTQITIVLGLLLLYCGVVIRWAVSAPAPRAVRRPGSPRT